MQSLLYNLLPIFNSKREHLVPYDSWYSRLQQRLTYVLISSPLQTLLADVQSLLALTDSIRVGSVPISVLAL